MRPRIREELAHLREHYDDVVHAEKNGEDWFLLPSFPIPPGWNDDAVSVTHLPIAFQVKPGYPGAAPYGFLVPKRTSCGDSAPDNSGDPPTEPPFPGDWLHLSWTVEDWSPAAEVRGGSNLVAWCRSFGCVFGGQVNAVLVIREAVYAALWAHLFPEHDAVEQGAFLFLKSSSDGARITFEVADIRMLGHADYVHQESHGLELTDAAHASLIKHAHDIGASLAEAHSHRGPWPARFSCVDIAGLRETVPHMWWRLRQRPYIALVFTPASGFDALVWLDNPRTPRPLDALVVGSSQKAPSGLSLGYW